MIIEAVKRGHQAIGSGSRDMKVFVTGIGGQLGYDCVNELALRGHEAAGSDLQEEYSGIASYVQLDITNKDAVQETIEKIKPDASIVQHGRMWMGLKRKRTE